MVTDALILAAGFGSRLQSEEPCKPLTRVCGLSLLEIGIRNLQSAGIERVVVATGYRASAIEAKLASIARKLGITIIPRRVADFSKPNGYSVLAAADALPGAFLLQMADHLFSQQIVAAMASLHSPKVSATLAIDRRTQSELVDPEDATLVAVSDDNRIRHIGKQIATYDAVDCGIFHATPELFVAIEAAIEEGKQGSLSEGMQHLADQGAADVLDIGNAWWIDVDDPKSLRLAREQAPLHLPEIVTINAGNNAQEKAA